MRWYYRGRSFLQSIVTDCCWPAVKRNKKCIFSVAAMYIVFTQLLMYHLNELYARAPYPDILVYFQDQIAVYNKLGTERVSNPELMEELLDSYLVSSHFKREFWTNSLSSRLIYEKFHKPENISVDDTHTDGEKGRRKSSSEKLAAWRKKKKLRIRIVTAICGKWSITQIKAFFKSVVIFGQDSYIHIIVFGDITGYTLEIPAILLKLRWTANGQGWDFTFEVRFPTFPADRGHLWSQMLRPCNSQPLFLGSALREYRSVMYLDSDTIILSNLTQIWEEGFKMEKEQSIAMGPHMVSPGIGIYQVNNNIPYYGENGLSSNLIIMNLRELRQQSFEEKVYGAYTLYKNKLNFHPQDILNIVFNTHSELVMQLDCTYNFNSLFCGHREGVRDKQCLFDEIEEGPRCFCFPSLNQSIHAVHVNDRDIPYEEGSRDPGTIFSHLQKLISNFDLAQFDLVPSLNRLLENLKNGFNSFDRPCFNLTGELMYNNTLNYFRNLTKRAELEQ